MNMLRDEILQRLNEVSSYFALVDEKNTLLSDSAVFLVFDVKSEAEEAQKRDFPNSKIVSVKFVAPESASDEAEMCYLVADKHEHDKKLFIPYEEFDYYTPKAVFVPEIRDDYIRDEVDANVMLKAYIEKM